MPERVVNWFEFVEIQEADSQQGTAPLDVGLGLAQPVGEQTAVGQASQAIVGSRLFQALLAFLEVGNVAESAHVMGDPACGIADTGDIEYFRRDAAVLAPVARLEIDPLGRAQHQGDALETRLAGLWRELLGVNSVGLDEDFFALGGDSLLGIDLQAARQRLEAIDWVASATVERRLPDTIHIAIVERRPFARWQIEGKTVLIDRQGVVLERDDPEQYRDLLRAIAIVEALLDGRTPRRVPASLKLFQSVA